MIGETVHPTPVWYRFFRQRKMHLANDFSNSLIGWPSTWKFWGRLISSLRFSLSRLYYATPYSTSLYWIVSPWFHFLRCPVRFWSFTCPNKDPHVQGRKKCLMQQPALSSSKQTPIRNDRPPKLTHRSCYACCE